MKRLNPTIALGHTPFTAQPREGKKLIRQRKEMNKTEEAALVYLTAMFPNERIEREGLKFSVGNGAYFIPDFTIEIGDKIRCYEVKGIGGHIEDDAAVKIKTAASIWKKHHIFILLWPQDRAGREWNTQRVWP